VKSHAPDLSRGVMPAQLLPLCGFIVPPKKGQDDHALQELILRVNAGSLSYLQVPPALTYRWAALCGRWACDLQTFVAQALRHTGNLDNFLVQPAALDHHGGAYGLLECSITAAELAMNPCHRPGSYEPLPPLLVPPARIAEVPVVNASTDRNVAVMRTSDPKITVIWYY